MSSQHAARLPAFQQASADLIVQKLSSTSGPCRFLLADEVGLGKTFVAAEVIRQMHTHGRRAFAVLYVCSNTEICRQNLKRLGPNAQPLPVKRLTLLASVSKQISKGRRQRRLQILPLTPRTSFDVSTGTGLAEERRLILYLLVRLYRVPPGRYREWLRGNVRKPRNPRDDRWRWQTSKSALRKEFPNIDPSLLGSVRGRWRGLLRELEAAHNSRASLSKVIGKFRVGLAGAVLDHVNPTLLVLDEFQKYREFLNETKEGDETTIRKSVLSGKRAVPVLLLSATPYRLYTTRAEDQDGKSHWDELFEVLRFLRRDQSTSWTNRLSDRLDRFQELLRKVATDSDNSSSRMELSTLKGEIENDLGSVMCRTERNWYLEEKCHVPELPSQRAEQPSVKALTEFLRVRRASIGKRVAGQQVVDFWKSCPSFPSFIGSRYVLGRTLGLRRSLRLSARQVGTSYRANLKTEYLFERLFTRGSLPLWASPRYSFYKTLQNGDTQKIAKYLVFSHWRYVPGAIAGLVSLEAERQIRMPALQFDGRAHDEFSQPLRLDEDGPFTAFDLCFPHPLLAEIGDPLVAARSLGRAASEVSASELERHVRLELLKRLKQSRITVGTGETRPWRVVAWLETRESITESRHEVISRAAKTVDRSLRSYASRYREWAGEVDRLRTLRVSEATVDRLVNIAIYSPASCVFRCFKRALGQPEAIDAKLYGELVRLCLSSLRHYWNRPTTQAVVRRHSRSRTYSERALSYCATYQFEAVLDEYLYLLAPALRLHSQDDSAADATKEVLSTLQRVFGLGSGSPTIHLKDKGTRSLRSHFAVAFTEDDEGEGGKGETGRADRRAGVREAFNSPFWPFVLATTSLGQEGLDFHLYCRDIIHWNLPTNPVDLEQREGRINRRNCLSIRQNLPNDVDASTLRGADAPLLKQAFDTLQSRAHRHAHEKHGLYPHWVYDGGQGDATMLTRHLPFYESSADVERYRRLCKRLSLYRLAFGQANQDDLLDDLESADSSHLAPYMLNLAPFRGGFVWSAARDEAAVRLASSDAGVWLKQLCLDSQKKLEDCASELGPKACAACQRLLAFVQSAKVDGRASVRLRDAVAALVYLRNPYDDRFDVHREVGFEDDARRLVQIAAKI